MLHHKFASPNRVVGLRRVPVQGLPTNASNAIVPVKSC